MKRIECIEEILAYSDPENLWVQLYFDRVQFPNGTTGRYNRIVEGRGYDGVAVLPIWGNKLGLIRTFRYPIGKEVLEIPRGFGKTSNAETEATRELKEETGLTANRLLSLGEVHPNSGLLMSTVHLFAAVCNDHKDAGVADNNEVIGFQWMQSQEVFQLVANNKITDCFTIASLLRASLKNLL